MSIITPITVDGFPRYARPWNNITPFTYRDGLTYLEVLEGMRLWLRDSLVPHIDGEMSAIGEAWNSEVLALIASVESALAAHDSLTDTTIATAKTDLDAKIADANTAMATAVTDINARADQWLTTQISNNDIITTDIINDTQSTSRAAVISAVSTTTDNKINEQAIKGALRGSAGKNYHVIACALRNANDGNGWQPIVDANHAPQGIGTVAQDDTAITIQHLAPTGKNITKVVSLSVMPDETLSNSGITAGASVGLTSSSIQIARTQPLADFIAYSGVSPEVNSGFVSNNNAFTMSWDSATSTLTLSHPDLTYWPKEAVSVESNGRTLIPVVSQVAGSVTNTAVKIQFVDWAGTLVTVLSNSMRATIIRNGVARVKPSTVHTGTYPSSNLWVVGIFETN